MRVFLSWSGERSKYLANLFKEWLPNVLQYIDPYMSAKDISLGERWSVNIEESLRNNDFGLVFVTPENIDAPWINFEAGALSKNLQSRLIPMIYDTDVSILNNGPLKQFQSQKNFEKESIRELVKSINAISDDRSRLLNERLESSFEKWWPDLEKLMEEIPTLGEANQNENKKIEDTFEKKALVQLIEKIDKIERNSNASEINIDELDRFFDQLSIEVGNMISMNQQSMNQFKQYSGVLETNEQKEMMNKLLAAYSSSQRLNAIIHGFFQKLNKL